MEENNKTVIAMEFVDEDKQEDKPEVTDLQKVEEKPKGPFGKFVNWVTTPVRFVWNKAKKSPVVAGLGGAALGAAGGWAAKTAYDSFKQKSKGSGFIPADPIEVPDDGEYTTSGASYESTEE